MEKNIEIENVCLGKVLFDTIILELLSEDANYENFLQILVEQALTSKECARNG